MKNAAKRGMRWLGSAGALGLVFGAAGVATAGDHPADCSACQSYYGRAKAAGHVHVGSGQTPSLPGDYPRGSDGAPVVYERQGLVDRLLGRKQYSIPLYHQTEGEKPVPLYQASNGALLAAASPAPPVGPFAEDPAMAAHGSYAADAMPAVAYGEPAPIGVMRTDYQAMAAEAAARAGAMGGPAGPRGPMGGPMMSGPAMGAPGMMPGESDGHDPRIDLWHTKIRSGSSMVAGGEKKSLLSRLADGESPLDRWREARRTRKTLRAYGTLAPVPVGGPSQGMMPGMGMGGPR